MSALKNHATHTVEFQLIVSSAVSVLFDRRDATLSKQVQGSPLNWTDTVRLARRHGTTTVLWTALHANCWDLVPATARADLERRRNAVARRNAVLTSELVRIVAKFEQARILVATFKGAALGQELYQNLSLREFADLDLIVRGSDISRAEEVLAELGYSTGSHQDDTRQYSDAIGQYLFQDCETGIKVDLHTELAPFQSPFPFSLDDMWRELRRIEIAGAPVPTMSYDHLVLFLAYHGTKERWRLLKWVCDFGMAIRCNPGIDWDSILRQAKLAGCGRSVLLAVLFAADILGVEADSRILEEARADGSVRALAKESFRRLSLGEAESELDVSLYALRTRNRWRDKLILIKALATTLTVSDHRSFQLPRALAPLRYVLRPFRVGVRVVEMTMARLFHRKA